jgi:uncharacterized membrane protein (DUF441 family)
MKIDPDAITKGFLIGTVLAVVFVLIVIFGPIITGGPWIK